MLSSSLAIMILNIALKAIIAIIVIYIDLKHRKSTSELEKDEKQLDMSWFGAEDKNEDK